MIRVVDEWPAFDELSEFVNRVPDRQCSKIRYCVARFVFSGGSAVTCDDFPLLQEDCPDPVLACVGPDLALFFFGSK